jgi:hypothetical protein
MYWISEAQTTDWDDPVFDAGEIWSHYLYNIVIWEGVLQHSGKESLTSIPRSSANQSRKGRKNPEPARQCRERKATETKSPPGDGTTLVRLHSNLKSMSFVSVRSSPLDQTLECVNRCLIVGLPITSRSPA